MRRERRRERRGEREAVQGGQGEGEGRGNEKGQAMCLDSTAAKQNAILTADDQSTEHKILLVLPWGQYHLLAGSPVTHTTVQSGTITGKESCCTTNHAIACTSHRQRLCIHYATAADHKTACYAAQWSETLPDVTRFF